jgi:hypothetical protein
MTFVPLLSAILVPDVLNHSGVAEKHGEAGKTAAAAIKLTVRRKRSINKSTSRFSQKAIHWPSSIFRLRDMWQLLLHAITELKRGYLPELKSW